MVRSILAVALMALLAVSASAYDFLYSDDTAMTHDAGAFGFKVAFIYGTATSVYDESGDEADFENNGEVTAIWIPVDVYYSAGDALEIGIQPKFVNLKYTYDEAEVARAETGEYTGSGIGDTWVKVKYMFMPDPMMTARVAVKIPTGTEPDAYGNDEDGDLATGDGQMDIDGAVLFGMPAGPGQFDGAVGYRYRMAQKDVESPAELRADTYDITPGSEIHFYAGYTYFLNDMMNLKIAADGFFGGETDSEVSESRADDEPDTAVNAVYVSPGLEYMMENGMTLGAGFHYMLMGKNIEKGWRLSAYLGWGA